MKKIPLGTTEYYAFNVPCISKQKGICVTSLTPEEEQDLDKGYPIDIIRNKEKIRINPKNIIVYGEIDFNDDSEDLDTLYNLNLFEYCSDLGFCLPSNYSYKDNCLYVDTSKKVLPYFDTTSTDRILQYIHARLGKPTITVVFEL